MDIPREKKRSPKKYIFGSLAVVAILGVTVGLSRLKPAAPSVDRNTLYFGSVSSGELVRQVRGPGTLVPEQIRFVSALTAGRVERKLRFPGDTVSVGTVILEMSNPDVELLALQADQNLSGAQANLISLRSNLEQGRLSQEGAVATTQMLFLAAQRAVRANEQLTQDNLISQSELEASREVATELETRLRIAQDRLALMGRTATEQLEVEQRQIARLRDMRDFQQQRLRSMRVTAGVDGVIRDLPLEEGQWVNSGEQLARVVQPGRLRADLRIPETQVQDVVVGQVAFIDTRTDTIPGRVRHIDPAAENGSVRVEITLEVEDLPPSARPNLSIDGTIEIDRLADVLHMGRPAFGSSRQSIGIFRLVPGTNEAVRISVQIGLASVNEVEIISGLAAGDSVILSDMGRWDNFDRVRLR